MLFNLLNFLRLFISLAIAPAAMSFPLSLTQKLCMVKFSFGYGLFEDVAGLKF